MSFYGINKLMYDLREEVNRSAFKSDEEAYCGRYALSEEEGRAVRERDWKRMNELGASIYVMTKLGAVVGVNLYQMGAHMRGQSFEEYQQFIADQERRAAPYALVPRESRADG